MLKKIGEEARVRGLDVEYYHHPLDPKKIEHLIIPNINTALITTDEPVNKECRASYNLNNYLKDRKHIAEEKKMNELINEAILNLQRAKELHVELENYYIPNMNFEGINKCRERVLQEIERLEAASVVRYTNNILSNMNTLVP